MNTHFLSHSVAGKRPGSASSSALPAFLPLLALAWAAVCPAVPAYAADTFTIAIVRDGAPPGPGRDKPAMVERELPGHLPDHLTVVFKSVPAFDAGWLPEHAPDALKAALNDPDVDLILADGSMITMAASEEGRALAKPVVSSYVQRADLLRLPYTEDNRSAKENFIFMAMPSRVSQDVETFRSLVSFGRLHILAGDGDLAAIKDLAAIIAQMEGDLDTEFILVPSGGDAAAVLAGLDEGVQAVYLTGLPRFSLDQRMRLIAGLTERGIPSFSLIGHTDVRLGALGALSPDITGQVVRRTALNLSRLIRGETTGDLPVLLTVDTGLLINARTAVAVGYTPDLETRIYTRFLYEEAFDGDSETLSLVQAMKMAEAGSTMLSVEDSLLESVRQEEKIARSPLFPQMQADFAHAQTDALSAFTNAGITGDGATMGRATLRQMLYDDGVVSGWRASKRLTEAGAEEYESARLDVRAMAGQAFLNLAQAQALYKVRVDNLRLTRDNLELARLRRDVGYSGRDEIYRWEAQLADQRSQLLRSSQDVETAMIALNQILGTSQDRRWRPEELLVDLDNFSFGGGSIDGVFRDPSRHEALRDAMIGLALERSPEIRALSRTIEAQEIGLNQLGRRYFLPSFFVDLSYANELIRGDVNSFPEGDDSFAFMVGASYPFFEGGRKVSERARGKADLEALERRLNLAGELVEQQTRTALNRVGSSFSRIGLSRSSAEVAAKNLELVQEKYAEGVVNVTDLDSAQNQLFIAEQTATAAVYEFLLDLVALQRAVSWFEDEVDPGELERFLEGVETAAAGQ